MKKYKVMRIMSTVLIGGGALVSLPLALTSCSKDGKLPDFKKIGMDINLDGLNNVQVSKWNSFAVSTELDYSKVTLPDSLYSMQVMGIGILQNISSDAVVTIGAYTDFDLTSTTKIASIRFGALLQDARAGTYNLSIQLYFSIVVDELSNPIVICEQSFNVPNLVIGV